MGVFQKGAGLVLFLAQFAPVQSMNLDDKDGILDASKGLAGDLISFYKGNESGQIPGLLPETHMKTDDYYWYESGAFMGSFVDYWQLTGDKTYNKLVTEGIQWQVGKGDDFMPANQTANIGNDDQSVWALAALTAAEYGFPEPPENQPQWLELAVAVWQEQRSRWDTEVEQKTCDGGLRWQIMMTNAGFNYKSTMANMLFFNIGARLARLTSNETYADYATKTWDWLEGQGLIDSETWAVYDGTRAMSDSKNCSSINQIQFSANSAGLTMGAAFMYNFTEGSDEWRKRTNNLASATLKTFFKQNGDFTEVACSSKAKCPRDIVMYKGFTHRWLAVATQVAPFTASSILPVLRKSAEGLKADGNGDDALEQKYSNFVVVSNLLIDDSSAPGFQNETSKTDKAQESPSSSSAPAAKSSSGEAEGNAAVKLAGSGSFLAFSVLVVASQWLL
ncbi:mannan endo-1 6-alpha-mannosidase DCW1 [Fusarium beomiforme]|uniref:mannan endo-1,6-alpha-mannosidase n=1 Tax=Fusarium beomiforme TaxID=44412 RepID=A0A9P5AUQ1_9HYPO|nr:mannan endo-1 6-alpha-mannosidase DCW1 [Fusarium beomiforme]